MARRPCTATTKSGEPCKGFAVGGDDRCFAHSPTMRSRHKSASRRGGAHKAASIRMARQWAAIGRDIGSDELAAIVKAAMLDTLRGDLEPGRASAAAQLARTAMQLDERATLEQEIAAIKQALGMTDPTPIRKVS